MNVIIIVSILCEAYAPRSVLFVSVFSFAFSCGLSSTLLLLHIDHEVGPWGAEFVKN